MQTPDHTEISRELKEHPAKKGLVFNVAVTVLEIGGAIALFHGVKSAGGTDVVAYLVGSIAPLLGAVVFVRRASCCPPRPTTGTRPCRSLRSGWPWV